MDVVSTEHLEALFDGGDMVVEIGCGAGGVLYHFSRQLKEKGFYNCAVGYDISPKAIEMAKNQYGEDVKFICSKEVNLDKKISVVLLVDVLEHLVDPADFLQASKKLTSYFLIRLPLDNNLWNIALNKLPKLERELGHIHYYTYMSAKKFIKSQGLDIVNMRLTKNFIAKSNQKTIVSKIMRPVRILTSLISVRLNSLLWGGNSIVVFAKVRD